jgi:Family of unknown function (DUF6625)
MSRPRNMCSGDYRTSRYQLMGSDRHGSCSPLGQDMNSNAVLVLPYFGSFGPWFSLYLHGLANQHTLDLLLLSDSAPPQELPANARRIEMTFDRLRELATDTLRTPVLLHGIRNICDLRPAYGLIFADFIDGYKYWAFGDEDVLYGDLDGLLKPQLDKTADLVRPGTNGKSGHLTLVRNCPEMNALAMRDPAYKEVLASREHWAYDETSWRCGGHVSSFHKIVTEAEARGELSISRGLPRAVNVPAPGRWYVYDGTRLRDDHGNELLYYHWGRMRRRKIRWPDAAEARNGFAFDRYGFYDPALGGARLIARRTAGRLGELATNARSRLSDARAALRSAASGSTARATPS